MRLLMKYIVVILLLFSAGLQAQKKDPDKILDEVIKNFNKVEDYTVNVKVKVDVPFIKAPDTDAVIYFKQPDKVHFASENFALVPKEGLDFSPMGLLKNSYTAIYIDEEEINGKEHSVIKIIPLEDRGDVILSTLWIDTQKDVVTKVESSTKTSGKFIMELSYDNNLKYPLPSSMVFSFKFANMPGRRGQQHTADDTEPKKEEEISGKVYITYTDYKVNTGLPDSIFEEKKK
jgi:hypothetical protein